MTPFYVSQLFAAVSFSVGLLAVQFKNRRSVLLLLSVATTFNATHFLLLDRPGAAAVLGLTGVRYLTAIGTTNRRVMYVFLALSVVCFLFTYKNSVSFLALFAVVVGTYGSFQPTDRIMRRYFMCGNSTWLIHNTLASTPVGVLMEVSFLISNIVGYCRFYLLPKDEVT